MPEETKEALSNKARSQAGELPSSTTRTRFDVRTITYVAVSVALAAALNFVPLFKMPQGGSVALDMVPIIFLAFYRGVRPGVLAGVIYGFVDYIFSPFFVHPAQLLLDYPLAFGLLGLAGLAGNRGPLLVSLGTVFAGLLRFGAHYFSGVIFFASYAPEGQSPWLYSAIYNGSYMSVSILLSIPIVYTLLKVMNAEGAQTSNQGSYGTRRGHDRP